MSLEILKFGLLGNFLSDETLFSWVIVSRMSWSHLHFRKLGDRNWDASLATQINWQLTQCFVAKVFNTYLLFVMDLIPIKTGEHTAGPLTWFTAKQASICQHLMRKPFNRAFCHYCDCDVYFSWNFHGNKSCARPWVNICYSIPVIWVIQQ